MGKKKEQKGKKKEQPGYFFQDTRAKKKFSMYGNKKCKRGTFNLTVMYEIYLHKIKQIHT